MDNISAFELDTFDTALDNEDFAENDFDEELRELEGFDIDLTSLNGHSLNAKQSEWRDGPAPIEESERLSLEKLARLVVSEVDHTREDIALLNYFNDLAGKSATECFNFDFVNNLLVRGDINLTDELGQTLMHDVAREWNVDVAKFLKFKGARIDKADNYGRTPLFVAVVSGHEEMIDWLLQNGANLNHSDNRGMKPIHYAAQYDSLKGLKKLIDCGANPDEKDLYEESPLFIAAKYGSDKVCEYLLRLEVPVATYTTYGSTPMEQILLNVPDVAEKALDQYIFRSEQINSKLYYINCLTTRRWQQLSTLKKKQRERRMYPTVLEILVEKNDLKHVLHPIINEYVKSLMSFFGYKYVLGNIITSLLFTLTWTVAASLIRNDDKFGSDRGYVSVAFTVLGAGLTVFGFIKLYLENKSKNARHETLRFHRLKELQRREEFCHPAWPIEKKVVSDEKEAVLRAKSPFLNDAWMFIDLFALILSVVYIIITIVWAAGNDYESFHLGRSIFCVVFLVSIWLRINRSLQVVESFGHFVTALGACVKASYQFAFLFFEFYIPFVCAMWLLFGGARQGDRERVHWKQIGQISTNRLPRVCTNSYNQNQRPLPEAVQLTFIYSKSTIETEKGFEDSEYSRIQDLMYQVYLLTIIGDYDFDTLAAINKIAAEVLVGLYAFLVGIVCINVFIALLSEAFATVNNDAVSVVYLNQAKNLLNITHMFPDNMIKFEKYAMKHYAPKKQRNVYCDEDTSNINEADVVSLNIQDLNKEVQYMSKAQTEIYESLDLFCNTTKTFQNEGAGEEKMDGIFRAVMKLLKFQDSYYEESLKRSIPVELAIQLDKLKTRLIGRKPPEDEDF